MLNNSPLATTPLWLAPVYSPPPRWETTQALAPTPTMTYIGIMQQFKWKWIWVWDHAELFPPLSFSFFLTAVFSISTVGEWIRKKLLEWLIKEAGLNVRHVCWLCVWGRRCRGEESEWQWSNWPIWKAVCHGVCRSQPEPPNAAPHPSWNHFCNLHEWFI